MAVAALAALLLAGAPATAAAQPAVDPPTGDDRTPAEQLASNGQTGPYQVTLITGDVVDVSASGNGQYAATTYPRDGISISLLSTPDGDLYAFPSDAAELVAAGRLDRELFNVATLVEAGYTDHLPVIVEFAGGRPAAAGRAAAAAQADPVAALPDQLGSLPDAVALPSINGAAVSLPAEELPDLWQQVQRTRPAVGLPDDLPVGRFAAATTTTIAPAWEKVWLDAPVYAALDISVPQVGAPQAWAQGVDGTGVTVAVLDTGVDATHPDLAGKIAGTESFVPGESVVDGHGHGTHVASTVLGSGAASGGQYTGVAPGAPVTAARATGTGSDGSAYIGMQGTSMATPHVAGAAAILAQQHPEWSAEQLKAALTGSARPHPDLTSYQQGAGRLDIPAALDQNLLLTPSALDFGPIPHPWEEPVTRTITLSNHGGTPVAVDLTTTLRGPLGPADGVVSFEPASVTVPAGGSASVAATYHPTSGVEGGFTGQLRAVSGGDTVLVAAVAAYQQPLSHTLRLIPIPPEGWPSFADFTFWVLIRVDAPQEPILVGRGVPFADVVVPDGVYSASVSFSYYHPQRGDLLTTVLVDPEVVVDGEDTQLVIDGNAAKPLQVETPLPSELREVQHAVVRKTTYGGAYGVTYNAEWRHNRAQLLVTPTEPVTVGGVQFVTAVSAPERSLLLRTAGADGETVSATWGHSYYQEPRLGGEYSVELVDVGSGTAEEIAAVEVAGRLALVGLRFNDYGEVMNAPGGPYEELAQRLADAGALAMVAYLDRSAPYWCAQGYLSNICNGVRQDYTAPLPIISLGPVDGTKLAQLAADGPVPMELSSRDTDAAYEYRLYLTSEVISDPFAYRVTEAELAAVTHRYHTPAAFDLYDRVFTMPLGSPLGFITSTYRSEAPLTQYVGPVSDQLLWMHELAGTVRADRHLVFHERRFVLTENQVAVYDQPAPRTLHWGRPSTVGAFRLPAELVGNPLADLYPFNGNCLFCRGDDLLINGLGLTGGDGTRIGENLLLQTVLAPEYFQAHLYRNGEEVPALLPGGAWDLSAYPEPAEYRFTHQVDGFLTYPSKITSEWVFESMQPDGNEARYPFECPDVLTMVQNCRVERALFFGFQVDPMLRLDNTAAAPGAAAVTISVFRQVGAPAPEVAGLELEISYDGGESWTAAPVQRADNGEYLALLRHPAEADTVSLRAAAWDTDGNRVTQTLIDYYPLASQCDRTVVGTLNGPLRINSGVTCLAAGAQVRGPVTVAAGAGLVATGARFSGPVSANGAATVVLSGSEISGPVSLSGVTELLALAGNTIRGPLSLRDNQPAAGPPVVAGNQVQGPMSCTGNSPEPTAVGLGNQVNGPASGQCRALTS